MIPGKNTYDEYRPIQMISAPQGYMAVFADEPMHLEPVVAFVICEIITHPIGCDAGSCECGGAEGSRYRRVVPFVAVEMDLEPATETHNYIGLVRPGTTAEELAGWQREATKHVQRKDKRTP